MKEYKDRGEYHVGQVFKSPHGRFWILVQVQSHRVCAVSLDEGNRYADPIHVIDPKDITPTEFRSLGLPNAIKLFRNQCHPC